MHPSAFYPGSPAAEAEGRYFRALGLYQDGEITAAEAMAAGVTQAEVDQLDVELAAFRAEEAELARVLLRGEPCRECSTTPCSCQPWDEAHLPEWDGWAR